MSDGKRRQQSEARLSGVILAHTCLGHVKFSSNPSIPFRSFSVFPTTWGICSSLDRNPQWLFQIGF